MKKQKLNKMKETKKGINVKVQQKKYKGLKII